MRNDDGDEGDELWEVIFFFFAEKWEVIEMLQFGQCLGWDEEGDFVAFLG